jgi:hypothetical protein
VRTADEDLAKAAASSSSRSQSGRATVSVPTELEIRQGKMLLKLRKPIRIVIQSFAGQRNAGARWGECPVTANFGMRFEGLQLAERGPMPVTSIDRS